MPLCVVVVNTNTSGVLEVNLDVGGSLVPIVDNTDDGGRLSTTEIVLICVGSFLGLLVLILLVVLVSYLLCCKEPARAQVEPTDGPVDTNTMPAAKAPGLVTPSYVVVGAPPGGPGPPMYPYGPYGMPPYPPPDMRRGPMYLPPPYAGGPRSPPSALAPLPPEAYTSMSRKDPDIVPGPPLPGQPTMPSVSAASTEQQQVGGQQHQPQQPPANPSPAVPPAPQQ